MKSRLANILLLGLALSGCSASEGLKDVDISGIQQAGDLAADLKNGKISDLANTGSVDAAGALSAGADPGEAIAICDKEAQPNIASEEAKLEKQSAGESANRASAAKAAPASSSVKALDRVSPGYYIQLSAEPAKAEAEAKASVLRASGFSALTQEVLVHGTPYYRVLVGPYKSKDLAKSSTPQVRASSLTDQEPFIQKLTWN